MIHTAGGAAGYMQPLGHVDFYPNGGVPPQPGCVETNSLNGLMQSCNYSLRGILSYFVSMLCTLLYIFTVTCSHGRAYNFFADSILYPSSFRAYKCDSWDALKNATCSGDPIVFMGDDTSPT